MKKPTSVAELQQMEAELQSVHDTAQVAMYDARAEYEKASTALVEFRNRYGRVLQMMREDDE